MRSLIDKVNVSLNDNTVRSYHEQLFYWNEYYRNVVTTIHTQYNLFYSQRGGKSQQSQQIQNFFLVIEKYFSPPVGISLQPASQPGQIKHNNVQGETQPDYSANVRDNFLAKLGIITITFFCSLRILFSVFFSLFSWRESYRSKLTMKNQVIASNLRRKGRE